MVFSSGVIENASPYDAFAREFCFVSSFIWVNRSLNDPIPTRKLLFILVNSSEVTGTNP